MKKGTNGGEDTTSSGPGEAFSGTSPAPRQSGDLGVFDHGLAA
jgi:hypothetical protein